MTNIPFDIFTDTLKGLVCERVLDEEIRSFIEDGYFESFDGLRLDLPDDLFVLFLEPISIFEQELLEEIVANHDGYDCPETLPEDEDELEESLFEEYEFTNLYRIKKITIWNNSNKDRKLKEYVMEYDGPKTTSVVEISFKNNGEENKRIVTQYNYNNFNIDNIVRFLG